MKQSSKILAWVTICAAFVLTSPAFGQRQPVPEIDPNMVQTGLTVLVGGVLVLIGRRRK
jgi:hypothetical protein